MVIMILLLATGCSANYDIEITDNGYSEKIILIAADNTEVANFNNNWQIPVDRNEYNIGFDSDAEYTPENGIYNTNLTGDALTFTNHFSKYAYADSTAVSICYNKLTVTDVDAILKCNKEIRIALRNMPTLPK